MDPQIRVGVDVGCKPHQVAIAGPEGRILDEFAISHAEKGKALFSTRVERRPL